MGRRYDTPHKTEHQHYQEFEAAAGRRINDRDYYAALRDETDALMGLVPAQGGPERKTRGALQDRIDDAAAQILNWHNHAIDYPVPDASTPADLATWIISRRPACAWAILQGIQTHLEKNGPYYPCGIEEHRHTSQHAALDCNTAQATEPRQ